MKVMKKMKKKPGQTFILLQNNLFKYSVFQVIGIRRIILVQECIY